MLKRIHIHNFRTFVNFEWSPPETCVIVGANGVGKSALIEVLWLLQDLLVAGHTIDETTFPSARTTWLATEAQIIELDVQVGSETLRYRLEVINEGNRGVLSEELRAGEVVLYRAAGGKAELFGEPPSPAARTIVPFDRRRSFISALEARADNRRIVAFRDAVAAIWAMKPDPRRLGGAAVAESAFLDRDLANFASWYRARVQEDPDAADALREDLRRSMTGFSTLRLEPISPEVKDLRVRFAFGGRTHEIGWAKLSDGQRLLIALYGMLRFGFPKASLIALDECENYVAPGEIQPWLRAVADAAAERRQQLLLVSHHPESINYLAADAAWRLWRDKEAGHSRIVRLDPDLSVGETAYDALKLGSTDDSSSEASEGTH